jgi:lysyl-tRNA synthetase class 2
VPDWRPTATVEALKRRAAVLADVRRFFEERNVWEVETPALAAAGVTDPRIEGLAVDYDGPGAPANGKLWLQTSPEYAMKRLLAAGSGSVFQVARAFRAGERGRLHNPEFTLLEWYRTGFDHHRLMDEVAALVQRVLGERGPVERLSYRQAFQDQTGIDPFTAEEAALRRKAAEMGLASALDRDEMLDLIMGSCVAPHLGRGRLTFVHDFPASQASLARLLPGDPPVAARFELFVEGIELANGFHELSDAREQRRRFEADRGRRAAEGGAVPGLDERLLSALEAGLPDCAGVALGLDRLLMLALGADRIEQVMAFPMERA